jgi:hypothetical protein
MELQKYQFGKVTGDEKYDSMICRVCETVATTQNHILDMYWQIGDALWSLVNATPENKISKVLEQVSQHVREASNDRLSELGPDSLRKAIKVRVSFDANQLELAKAGCISLRNLLPMCQKDVNDEERDKYLQEVVDGNIDQTELPEKVKEDHPQELKEEKRGGPRQKKEAPLGFMQRIKKDMDKLLTDFETNYTMHMATVMGSEDPTAKEEFERHHEAITNQEKLFVKLCELKNAAFQAYKDSE